MNRRVKAHGAHGLDAHVIAGEEARDDAVYRADGVSDLTPEARKILDALAVQERTFDELVAETGLDAASLNATLSMLELAMKIVRDSSQMYSLRRFA